MKIETERCQYVTGIIYQTNYAQIPPRTNDRGGFWTYKSVEIHVFASPTGYMLTSFGVPLLNWGISSINSSKIIGNFPAVLMNFNQLFLKLNQFICN